MTLFEYMSQRVKTRMYVVIKTKMRLFLGRVGCGESDIKEEAEGNHGRLLYQFFDEII